MSDPYWGLPDPTTQAGFYSGVTMKRLLAWVFDFVIIAAICLVIGLATIGLAWFLLPLMFLVGFVYRWLTIAGGSATWGMRMMAIELRTREGQPLDGGTAFLHTLGYTVSLAVSPLQLISVVLMLFSPRGQGLTDMLLGTAMLNRTATY